MKVIDTSTRITPRIAGLLRDDGYSAVIRYVTTSTGSAKCVQEAEARVMTSLNLDLALVFEVWGGVDGFKHGDINTITGKKHGEFAREWARRVGAPDGAAIYAAIDTDASNSEIARLVLPYLDAFKAAIGPLFRAGVYGSGSVCFAALGSGIPLSWLAQSTGWSGYKSFRDSRRWNLLQGPSGLVHGLNADPDEVNLDLGNFGQFRPFQAALPLSGGSPPAAPKPPAGPPAPPVAQNAPATPPASIAGLPAAKVAAIVRAAADSAVIHYGWKGQGNAPRGYVKGMAVAFGSTLVKLAAGDAAAVAMAAPVGSPGTDALAWYSVQFAGRSMRNDGPAAERLRHLFVLMMGLGMRESSGRYCEGRDKGADNKTSDTAEAGLFQQSWDSSRASAVLLPRMLAVEQTTPPDAEQSLLAIFKEGVTAHTSELANFGDGDGRDFQRLIKERPLFAVRCAAVGLRVLRSHWGPIVRREAEVTTMADDLLRQVASILTPDGAVA